MKSKLLFAGLITLGLTSKAQFGEKGQRLIGGQLGGAYASTDYTGGEKSNSVGANFTFSLGKFKKQNVLTSFSLITRYGFAERENAFGLVLSSNTYSLGLGYGKTYFKPLGKKIFFGIGGNVSALYTRNQNDLTASGPDEPLHNFTAALSLVPSLSYQVSKRFVANLSPGNSFLSLSLNFSEREVGSNKYSDRSISLNSGVWSAPLQNLSIGFSYLLKNK